MAKWVIASLLLVPIITFAGSTTDELIKQENEIYKQTGQYIEIPEKNNIRVDKIVNWNTNPPKRTFVIIEKKDNKEISKAFGAEAKKYTYEKNATTTIE